MQNSDFSTRITSLYGSRPTSVVFARKAATLGSELDVSMGPRLHLWFFCIQNSDFSTKIASLYWSQPSSVVLCITTATLWPELIVSIGPRLCFACKTTWLASELLVSMGPSPHLWFLHSKQRLLDQNYKSLLVPDFACWFVNAKQRA